MISHIKYIHKKRNLLEIISKLHYTGQIPSYKKETPEKTLKKLYGFIILLKSNKKLIREILFLNESMKVDINFCRTHLEKIHNFLLFQKKINDKFLKAEIEQKIGRVIIKRYRVKINEIKYDPKNIEDIDKAINTLTKIENEIKKLDLEEIIPCKAVYGSNYIYHTLLVCKILLKNNQHSLQSEIKIKSKLTNALTNKILYDLFGKSLIMGERGIAQDNEWFVYYWTPECELLSYVDKLVGLIAEEKKIEDEKIENWRDFIDSGDNKF